MRNKSAGQKLCYLLGNFDFVALLLILTSVYFITTGIQFWITDFWVAVLQVEKTKATIYFAVAAITGPVTGVILGGVIFSRIGGYESPRAFPICCLAMTVGSTIGFPLPFVENYLLSAFLIWTQFFCGGFCLPALMAL
jgi:sugar phosphate permease